MVHPVYIFGRNSIRCSTSDVFQHDGTPAHHYRRIRRYSKISKLSNHSRWSGTVASKIILILLILIFGDMRKMLSIKLLQQLKMIW